MSSPILPFAKAFSLEGEHALITGGGTGLGLATAQCFVAAGARVTIVGRRPEPLQTACQELGANAAYLVADITNRGDVATLISEAEVKHGPLSILVNNAGIHLKKPAMATSDAEFQAVIQTHLFASFSLSREAAKGMLERGHGSILFTASMTSFIGAGRRLFSRQVGLSRSRPGPDRRMVGQWRPSERDCAGLDSIRDAGKGIGRRHRAPRQNHQPHPHGPNG